MSDPVGNGSPNGTATPERPAAPSVLERVLALSTRSPRSAVRLARRALLSPRLRAPAERGRVLRAYGHALRAIGEFASARSAYLRARRTFRSAPGLEFERALCAIGLVDACMFLGRNQEALAVADEARTAFVRQRDGRRLAMLETNVGNLHHRSESLDLALHHYGRAARLLGRSGSERERASVDHNRANILTSLGRRREAEQLFHSAERTFRESGEPILAAQARYGISCLRFLSGEYAAAIAELEMVRPELMKLGARPLLALADLDLAEVLLAMRLFPEALSLARAADRWFRSHHVPADQARCSLVIGTALARSGSPIRAQRALAGADRLFRRLENSTGQAAVALSRARLWLESGRPRRAASHALRARSVLTREGFAVRGMAAGALAAEALLERGEHRRAAALARTLERDPRLPGDGYSRARLRRIRAVAATRIGDAPAALRAYREALHEARRAQTALFVDEWRIGFLEDEPAVLDEALGVLLSRRPRPRALEVRKWLSLASAPAPPRATSGPTPAVRELTQRLRTELEACHARLWKAHSGATRWLDSRSVRSLERKVLSLEGRLRRLARPAGAGLTAGARTEPPLAPGEMRVAYFSAGGRLGAMRHDREGWTLIPDLADLADVGQWVRLLGYQMDVRASGVSQLSPHFGLLAARADEHLRALGEKLLDPVLPPGTAVCPLRVRPHGILARVPFHALHWLGRPFVEQGQVAVEFAPALPAPRRPGRSGACVLGHGGADHEAIEGEARDVATALRGGDVETRLETGGNAGAAALVEAAEGAAVLHLAGHAVYRAEHPEFSALRLADGWLHAADLAALPLGGSCVVLSACETGARGSSASGEMLGLVRGLVLAGARTVLASLWRIDDAATRRFMRQLYARWRATGTLGTALAEVQRNEAAAGRDAYFWAPFHLVGDPAFPWPSGIPSRA